MIYLRILVALGMIAAAHTIGTIETEKAIHKLLYYCNTYPDASLKYIDSGMILNVHSDVLYFSE